MSKKIGFKAAKIRSDDKGSHNSGGQKEGKKAVVGKEKATPLPAHEQMKKVIADFRKQGKRRINMLPDTGAFH